MGKKEQGNHGGNVWVTNWQDLANLLIPIISGAPRLDSNPADSLRKLTVSTVIVTFPADGIPATPFDATTTHVDLSFEGGSVRWTDDGSSPVAGSHGHLFRAETYTRVSKERATKMKFIRETALDGVVFASTLIPV